MNNENRNLTVEFNFQSPPNLLLFDNQLVKLVRQLWKLNQLNQSPARYSTNFNPGD